MSDEDCIVAYSPKWHKRPAVACSTPKGSKMLGSVTGTLHSFAESHLYPSELV